MKHPSKEFRTYYDSKQRIVLKETEYYFTDYEDFMETRNSRTQSRASAVMTSLEIVQFKSSFYEFKCFKLVQTRIRHSGHTVCRMLKTQSLTSAEELVISRSSWSIRLSVFLEITALVQSEHSGQFESKIYPLGITVIQLPNKLRSFTNASNSSINFFPVS